jgi:hypothetical protein
LCVVALAGQFGAELFQVGEFFLVGVHEPRRLAGGSV